MCNGMQMDYNKKHIETEKKFYKKMNKQKTFLLTLLISGTGSFFLYSRYWSINSCKVIDLSIWTLIVVILFVFQVLIGNSIFEYERKKYT
jgi:hypothetical protein